MCRLSGFPRLALYDATGNRLAITLTNLGASSVRAQGITADSILDPDQSAGFAATYTRCRGARVAVHAQITLPGVVKRFNLPVDSQGEPLAPCQGAIGVSNL